jgi:glycosyltransferase involved in cell wall biosynthesis
VPRGELLLATDQPATRDGGQFCAFWAAAVRSFLEPGVRVAIAGPSREAERLDRLASGLGMRHLLISPGDDVRQEGVIAVADALLIPASVEGSVTAVAWAMAAGVPVIASANRATAELLAHQHNAFLIKPDVTKRLALRFAEALGHRHEWSKLRETARGQAYEVFSLRRYADQTAQVYENLVAGRAAATEVRDPALVGG